jgi:hypothetical protein
MNNTYAYTGNNPINRTDASGKDWLLDHGIVNVAQTLRSFAAIDQQCSDDLERQTQFLHAADLLVSVADAGRGRRFVKVAGAPVKVASGGIDFIRGGLEASQGVFGLAADLSEVTDVALFGGSKERLRAAGMDAVGSTLHITHGFSRMILNEVAIVGAIADVREAVTRHKVPLKMRAAFAIAELGLIGDDAVQEYFKLKSEFLVHAPSGGTPPGGVK